MWSNWLRPEAAASPERLFCHCYARGKGNAQMIPGNTVDAIRYLVREGIRWRAMPADFPHWRTVYEVLDSWGKSGATGAMHDPLRRACRIAAGRTPEPTAAVIDSQSVKAAETVVAASRGFDAGKKVQGRKRHIAVAAWPGRPPNPRIRTTRGGDVLPGR